MKESGTQNLKTERLLLRRMKSTDANELYECLGKDPMIFQYLPYHLWDSYEEAQMYVEDVISHYEDPFYFYWVIMKDERMIGVIHAVNNQLFIRSNEVGFCLASNYQKKGYMHEALACVLDDLINVVGYHKVTASTLEKNDDCIRLLESVGMKKEGLLHDEVIKDGKFQNVVLYAFIKEEKR